MCPRVYCLIPNQKVSANVAYMEKKDGDIMSPIIGPALFSFLAALSSRSACWLASFDSAPNAAIMRIEENISKDKADASSCKLSVTLWIFIKGGRSAPYYLCQDFSYCSISSQHTTMKMNGTEADATRVRSQLLMKATMYRPIVNASD